MRWAAVMESTFGRRVHEIRVIPKLQQRRTNKQLRASFLRNGVRAPAHAAQANLPSLSRNFFSLVRSQDAGVRADLPQIGAEWTSSCGTNTDLPFAHAELCAIR